jgi:hypothetical protein
VEVPVVGSPRPNEADNAKLGLATAALVETPATVGSRRVNGATTQGWKCRQRLFGAASWRSWVSRVRRDVVGKAKASCLGTERIRGFSLTIGRLQRRARYILAR